MSSPRLLLVLGLIVVAASCGSHEPTPPPLIAVSDPLPECEAYVSAYRACFGALGPEAHRLTEERAVGLHERFLDAARSEETREPTRAECARGEKQLREACR